MRCLPRISSRAYSAQYFLMDCACSGEARSDIATSTTSTTPIWSIELCPSPHKVHNDLNRQPEHQQHSTLTTQMYPYTIHTFSTATMLSQGKHKARRLRACSCSLNNWVETIMLPANNQRRFDNKHPDRFSPTGWTQRTRARVRSSLSSRPPAETGFANLHALQHH